MRRKPTNPDSSLETVSSTARLYPDDVARHAGEHQAITGTMQEFLRRGLAAQLAVDEVLERARALVVADPGRWIHLGCGGELTRLQGVNRPVCTACGKTVL